MSVNKKNSKPTASAKFSAARKASLAGVRRAAFNSGTSRNAVIAATSAALGRSPVVALYVAGKLELQIGFMAAALARKGDNRPDETLMEHCRDRLTNYQGFGGKQKLRKGMKGRRTKAEEEAYGSARVLVSGIMKEAGVRVPESRGGDTSKTRSARPAAKATSKQAQAANDTKPAVHRFGSKEKVVAYLQQHGAAMLATVNRSAKFVPIEAKSAVQDFVTAIGKIN